MKIEEAITILKKHNKWRRGADMPMTDPMTLGEAIDTVVEQYEHPAFDFFKEGWEAATDTAYKWLYDNADMYVNITDTLDTDAMIEGLSKEMAIQKEKSEKPTNLTWHKVANGDLPKDGQLVLISNPAIQFAIFKKVFSPVVRFGRKFEIDDSRIFVGVDYWMEIPEIKED